MAKNLIRTSDSPFIGSPIMYSVQAENLSSKDNIAFHRVRILVRAGLQGGDYKDIEMSSPVSEGETLSFDISSALRSIADEYEYSVEPPAVYPYVKYQLWVWDEYMQNGKMHENVGRVPVGDSIVYGALMGGFSDLDRMVSKSRLRTKSFSRKPSSMPEVVVEGETYIRPADMEETYLSLSTGPSSISYPITIDAEHPAGVREIVKGVNVFVMEKYNSDRYQFRFINSFGCMESIGVYSLATEKMNITKEEYVLSRKETFNKFSRGYISKVNDYETLEMSSGPLDRMWQQWFLHEFLMASWVWILIDGRWLPCHILPSDTITGADRVSRSLYQVQFSVRLDINGSPYLAV